MFRVFRIFQLPGGYLMSYLLVGLVMVECRLSGGYCYSRDLLENLVVELVVLVLGEYLLGMDDIVRRSCSEITK